MTQCIVYDESTKESETFCTLTVAKKWMRERMKQGIRSADRNTKSMQTGISLIAALSVSQAVTSHLSPTQGRLRKDIENKVMASLTNLPQKEQDMNEQVLNFNDLPSALSLVISKLNKESANQSPMQSVLAMSEI